MSEPNQGGDQNYPYQSDSDSAIFRGFEQVHSEENVFGTAISTENDLLGTKENRKPLYFLLFASTVLLIAIMVIVYVKLIAVGGGIAKETVHPSDSALSSASASVSGSTTPSSTPSDALETARKAVSGMVTEDTCADPTAAAGTISTFARESDGGTEDTDLVNTSLSGLSALCGADFTVSMQKALVGEASDFPASLYSLVTEQSWYSVARPAPDGAINTQEFASPSNNIRCQITDSGVSCSIYAYSYASPEGCEGRTATYTVGRSGDAVGNCETEVNAATMLAYGSSVSSGGFACTLDQTTGMECWSELSGHGFSIRRAAGTTF